jgi:hypothetical protein
VLHQPGPYDGGTMSDRIGVLHRFIPLVRGEEISDCQVAQNMARSLNRLMQIFKPNYGVRLYKRQSTENVVDCALCKPDNPEFISPEIYEIGKITGLEQVSPGISVEKSGRTSGLTSGRVSAVGVTLQVQISETEIGWFSEQVVCDMNSQPGDSGSLIVNNNKKAVGLLFAGSDKFTIFSPIENVCKNLGVELVY